MEADTRAQESVDKSEIKDVLSVVNYARDAGLWEEWSACYHPDATLTTSWFSGTRDEFVDAAKKMKIARHPGESQKHTVTNPWVRLKDTRAAAEHDLILYQRRLIDGVELDFTTWSRVLALLEKRDGAWRIWKRTNIYEKDRMDPYKPDELPPLVLRLHQFRRLSPRHPLPLLAKRENRPPARHKHRPPAQRGRGSRPQGGGGVVRRGVRRGLHGGF